MDQENVPPITFGFDFDDFDPSLMDRYFEFVENSEFIDKFEEIFIPIGMALKNVFFLNFDPNNRCKNEIEDKNEKYAVDSAFEFSTESILRPMVFTETGHQRLS